MFLFKLQPMYYDAHNWQSSGAFYVITPMEIDKFYDDSNKAAWQPWTDYSATTVVRRGQYLYYSTKDQNRDDPFYNWVGSSPEGTNSWIRGRGLHDYDCINTISPGATQRSGNLSLSIQPKKMTEAVESTKFYDTDAATYLILTGLRGDSVRLNFYDTVGSLLQPAKTIDSLETTTRVRIIRDKGSMSEPELPGFIRDTILSPIPTGTETITIEISAGLSGAFTRIGNIFIGNAYSIAKTEGSKLSIGATDYSRIAYDDWGKLSLQTGKRSKTLQTSLPIPNVLLEQEERILRLLQSCRATPTIFYGVNNIVSDTFLSSLSMICGLVKSSGIGEGSMKIKTLDLQIDGIPVDYNP